MANSKTFVGIDVSKNTLHVAIRPDGTRWSVPNTDNGIAELVGRLEALAPTRVVLEASGGYEAPLAAALLAAGLPAAIINPRHSRHFAQAIGRLAKTDNVDAEVLALFGEAVMPPISRLPTEDTQELADLVTRRQQVIAMITAESNRLATASERVRPSIRAHLEWLRAEQKRLDKQLRSALRACEHSRELDKLLQSVPGVGPVMSATIVAKLPEIGFLDRRQIASLTGVAPFSRDSGQYRGTRSVWGGRGDVRHVLYMATMSAIQHNPDIRQFYERLLAAGKKPKVALTACMRKLITILNAIVRDRTPWQSRLAVEA